jgi:hypothetical protein
LENENSDLILTAGSLAAQPAAFAANAFTDQLSSDAGKGSITGNVLGVPLSVIVQPIDQANLS